ncbi:MAG: DUF2807 domain-containing protein [Burkholderiaceae bacterium]|nr:DUF2807 domain-containing protein [Burkholderiaceae bacterium]
MNLRVVILAAVSVLLAAASPFASAAQRAVRLTPFSSLELSLPAHYIVRESGAASALMKGNSEVIDRIVVEQHDDRVRIYVPGSISIEGALTIEVNTVGLKELDVNGAGQVDAQGFSGQEFSLHLIGAPVAKIGGLDVEKLSVEMQGSGSAELSGRAGRERMRITGSGECRAADLASDKVEVKLEGSGKAEVMARERLKVNIAGAGSVRYRGDPKLSTSISGSGTVAGM